MAGTATRGDVRRRYWADVRGMMAGGTSARIAHGIAVNLLAGKCPDGCCGDEDGTKLPQVLAVVAPIAVWKD